MYGQADVDALAARPIRRKTIDRLSIPACLPSDQDARKGLDDRNAIQNLPFISAIAGLFLAFAPFAAPCANGRAIDLDPCLQRE